jgi:signal transduction histidine kinase
VTTTWILVDSARPSPVRGPPRPFRLVDHGPGFSATALARVGEFFFSEREGGMGIGLAVAGEIVRAHGGRLVAANEPGAGARVDVILPRRGPEEQP